MLVAARRRMASNQSSTNTLVFNNESVFISSFNPDPYSININTEAGKYVESPELAAQILAYIDEGEDVHLDKEKLAKRNY